MSYTNEGMQERLTLAHQAMENALQNGDLASRLAKRSYTVEKLSMGKALWKVAMDMHTEQIREYGESFSATDNYNSVWVDLLDEHRDLRSIAKVVFKKDRKSAKLLQLDLDLKRSKSGGEAQMRGVLDNALASEQIIADLTPYGYDVEKLNGMKDTLDSIPALKAIRDKEKTEAQQATIDRDEAMDALDEWMSDFVTIAKIAVKDKPELMELLGYTVS